MINKKIILPVLIISVVGVTLALVPGRAKADTPTPFSGLATTIAQKFNLNESDVQNVVNDYANQHKTDMQQKMQERNQTRLDNLVSQGKITTAQKQAILDEQNKLKGEYSQDSWKDLTTDQRRAQMQKIKDEVDAWAKSQNLDPKYVMFFGPFRGMHGGWDK